MVSTQGRYSRVWTKEESQEQRSLRLSAAGASVKHQKEILALPRGSEGEAFLGIVWLAPDARDKKARGRFLPLNMEETGMLFLHMQNESWFGC